MDDGNDPHVHVDVNVIHGEAAVRNFDLRAGR
jgi:hypothetical protein